MSCEQCTQGSVMNSEPTGKMVGNAYLHESSSGSKTRAVVLLTDIFGLPLVNCKIIADEISTRLDCDVWIPDLFNGKPLLTPEELLPIVPVKAGERMSWWNALRFRLGILPRIHRLFAIRAAVVDPRIDAFIKKVKEDHKYEFIGAVGYCFGGAAAVRLGSKSLVDGLVVCHPGPITVDEIRAITAPVSWVCAEDDFTFPTSQRKQMEAIFEGREGENTWVEWRMEVYEGTAHGFATRPELTDPVIAEAYQGALEQTVRWFQTTLVPQDD